MTTTSDGVRSNARHRPGARHSDGATAPAELRCAGVSFPLVADADQQLSLGRRSETRAEPPDIDLADLPNGRTVSRLHAWLHQRDGEWLLRVETGALNPTEIDGDSVPPGLDVPLEHGQTIKVAGVSLEFYQPETAVQIVEEDQVLLELAPADLRVEPGAAVTSSVRVINFTDHVDQFVVEVRGLPPSWYSLVYQGASARRAEIGLFQTQSRIAPASDAQARLQIVFNPPRECHSGAGEHAFTVRVTTRSSPRQRREIAGTLVILPFQGVELGQGSARTHATRGDYTWQVHNTGNARAPIDLVAAATDITGTGMFARVPTRFAERLNQASEPPLTFTWSSTRLALDGCDTEPARLAVAVRRRHWLGDPLQYHFTVSATSGAAVAIADSYLECPPRISTALQGVGRWIADRLPFLVALVVILGLAWTFFQPPEVIEFTAQPTDIVAGGQVTFTMKVKHAVFFTILNSNYAGKNIEFLKQLDETEDRWTETPQQTTQYILQANNGIGLTKSNDQVVQVHPRPAIEAFTAAPTTLAREGDAVQIDWKIVAAPDRPITIALAAVPQSGGQARQLASGPVADQLVDHPTDPETVYQLTLTDELGNAVDAKQRVVIAPPQLATFTAAPASVVQGGPVTLTWSGTGYSSLTLRAAADQNDTSQPEQTLDPTTGQLSEQPQASTWYTLTATNVAGSVSKRVEVLVTPAAVATPKLDYFVASPTMVNEGGMTTLSFSAQNTDSVLLRDAQGRTILQQDTTGAPTVMQSIDIVPDRTTAYALTLSNAGGQLNQAVTVQVVPATPTPEPTPQPTEAAP
ncbi:MAG: FHA domain-containing protein [Chloroflexi bacterium]|nr:FHA domain-containing protein [Chloroflexota bacterium]